MVDVDQEKKSGPVECPGIDSHILVLMVCVESSDDFVCHLENKLFMWG